MNILLDTHAFLWFISGDPKLSDKAQKAIENPGNLKLISIATLWEMSIKIGLGRLILSEPFEKFIPHQMEINGFELLHIDIGHAAKVSTLQFHHRDPFDRMLAAQCLTDDLMFVSCDSAFDPYGVTRIW